MRRGFMPSVVVPILSAAAASADIPSGPWPWQGAPKHPWGHGAPPPGWFKAHPPPQDKAPLVVEPATGDDRQTRLRLPGSLVKQLGASAGVVEEAPGGWAPTPTGTVVAGLAISLAVVLGGFWIIRQPRRRWIGAAATAATLALVIGVSGCPSLQQHPASYVERLPPLEIQGDDVLSGEALLEAGDRDEIVHLTIDKDDLAAWAAKAGPAPASK